MEQKNTVTELKCSLEELSITLDQAEDRMSKLEKSSFEIIKSEEWKKKI